MGNVGGKTLLRDEDIAELAEASGKPPEFIKEAYNSFLEDHPDGKMNKTKFIELMSQAHSKKNKKLMEDHVFRFYDQNRDGAVDFVEFMTVFYIMTEKSPQEIMTKLFQMFDVNHDGVVSKDEMLILLKTLFSLHGSKEPCVAGQALLASIFSEMDDNKDNKVSSEEFVKAIMGRKELSKLIAEKALNAVM